MTTLVETLGWTLIHSLWQGTLCWLVLRLSFLVIGPNTPRLRHLLACLALMAAAVLAAATFIKLQIGAPTAVPASSLAASMDRGSAPSASLLPAQWAGTVRLPARPVTLMIENLLPWVVFFWSLGCAWNMARLAGGYRWVRRIASEARACPVSGELQERVERLSARIGLRKAALAVETVLVDSPTVIGWRRPVVLVPAKAFGGLDSAQIDGVLVHELAHIARNDFLVNFLQSICDTVFFYHPAMLDISRRIRAEREMACDAIAAEITGDRRQYAVALARLEEARVPNLALAARSGSMLERFERLLKPSEKERAAPGLSLTALSIAALAAIALMLPGAVTRLTAQTPAPAAVVPALASPFERYPHSIEFTTHIPRWGTFTPGDAITIEGVFSDREHIEVGGTYVVVGTYSLHSFRYAQLGLSTTVNRNPGDHRPENPAGYTHTAISAGSRRFMMKIVLCEPGRMHVTFNPPGGGESFSTVYFDEKQMDIEKSGPTPAADLGKLPTSSDLPPSSTSKPDPR